MERSLRPFKSFTLLPPRRPPVLMCASRSFNSNEWFKYEASGSGTEANSAESEANRAFVRPVADNIICMIISPQLDKTTGGSAPTAIAPNYDYDSLSKGASQSALSQGTQHL